MRPSDMSVQDGLCAVQARSIEALAWAEADKREEFDGWMTCSWEQAMEFLGQQAENDMADRLSAARMIGLG